MARRRGRERSQAVFVSITEMDFLFKGETIECDCSETNRLLILDQETNLKMQGDEETVLYTKERVGYLVTLIITAMILLLLILPIYTLWHLSGEAQTQKTTAVTVGVLLIFTLVFSGVLSFFTRAKRHEILGCAAGSVYPFCHHSVDLRHK